MQKKKCKKRNANLPAVMIWKRHGVCWMPTSFFAIHCIVPKSWGICGLYLRIALDREKDWISFRCSKWTKKTRRTSSEDGGSSCLPCVVYLMKSF